MNSLKNQKKKNNFQFVKKDSIHFIFLNKIQKQTINSLIEKPECTHQKLLKQLKAINFNYIFYQHTLALKLENTWDCVFPGQQEKQILEESCKILAKSTFLDSFLQTQSFLARVLQTKLNLARCLQDSCKKWKVSPRNLQEKNFLVRILQEIC